MAAKPRIPTATYRLQFSRNFTFKDAIQVIPYLEKLGISDVYSSPFYRSRDKTDHGYDVINHNELNPVLGTEEDFKAFADALKQRGMGHIADFVPNHMGIADPDNEWWMDVLENGPGSVYASFFDIDWDPVKPQLQNKVLLPILGDQYGKVLESGQFELEFRDGAFFVKYFDWPSHSIPERIPRFYGSRWKSSKATTKKRCIWSLRASSPLSNICRPEPKSKMTRSESVLEKRRSLNAESPVSASSVHKSAMTSNAR